MVLAGQNYMSNHVLTLIALCRALAISLSLSSRGLLPKISGSQNWPTAPFMCWIFPNDGGGALTHCDGSLPTPHTMYAWVRVLGVGRLFDFASVDGSGCVILECSDDVRLGIIALSTTCSLVVGRFVSRV